MRIGRLLIGGAIIVGAVWVIVGEQISGVSSDAVVNARLSTVRAPMAGYIEMPHRAFGDHFDKDEKLATLKGLSHEDAQLSLGSPVEGALWEVLAGDGEYVERGQEIAKFMACGSALVTLAVADNVYERLHIGQTAEFRLDDSETVYQGTVTRMAGSGAQTIYRNLAVAPSLKHLEYYDIALVVPELLNDPVLRCTAGQSGRVFFDRRPLDWLRNALD